MPESGEIVRSRQSLCVIALTVALVVITLGLAVPVERRVHVRWTESATPANRIHAEEALSLEARERREERTWSYELADDSTANIARLLAHPLVEDTHHIDRARLTLAPEIPTARASIRRMYEHRFISTVAAWWHTLAAIFGGIALVLAWPSVRASSTSDPTRVTLAGILVASLLLRLVLIFSGGQFYWPDESRYQQTRELVAALVEHGPAAAFKEALEEPAHLLFKIIGMGPAAVEYLRGEDARIAACFFALFSVVNVWLVVRIARWLEADRVESLLAGTLFALAGSLLYYARHLVPYDLAMTFGLLATYAGTARAATWRSSIACGLWAACAFLTYAGYWTLGAAACLIHVLQAPTVRDGARRALLTVVGLASVLGIVVLVCAAVGAPVVENFLAFAKTVTQGSYDEGWRLPLEYLWHTEHFLFVGWLGALAWCLYNWRVWLPVRTVRAGIIGIAVIYGALVLGSVVLNVFVVYGRLARQLVPFFCLITASVLVSLWVARRRLALGAVMAGLLIQAGLNFRGPLMQQFPREFARSGEIRAERAGVCETKGVYTHHLQEVSAFTMPDGYTEMVTARHPLQFPPYQYEGFTAAQRQALRSADIRMRMVIPANGTGGC